LTDRFAAHQWVDDLLAHQSGDPKKAVPIIHFRSRGVCKSP